MTDKQNSAWPTLIKVGGIVVIIGLFGYLGYVTGNLANKRDELESKVVELTELQKENSLTNEELIKQQEAIDQYETENEQLNQNITDFKTKSEQLNQRIEDLTVTPISVELSDGCVSAYDTTEQQRLNNTPCNLVDAASSDVLYTFRDKIDLNSYNLAKSTESTQYISRGFGDGGCGSIKVYAFDRISGQVFEGPGASACSFLGINFNNEGCSQVQNYNDYSTWYETCISEQDKENDINFYSQFANNRESNRIYETYVK